ncbi:transcriptional regulator [Nakamurella flavida]|uniref:Transcriptional regulator n=1 Tax=Nakamurella flavida TaxID=363630 RepID=A0A939C5E7_9ACTN|nr:transcriptional regulator [Nakamurella flavida]MBM9476117.1 transcriptional regulator [Nakamurella flavida]MDP9777138.1 putative DNA-binding transcriptional regulator YafY [Nakamurella flavida]
MSTAARLLSLLGMLSDGREFSGAELAERLEVDIRTVRRDVDRLRGLGYPVAARRGNTGGYRFGTGGRMPPLLLDEAEAVAIVVGLRTVTAGAISSPPGTGAGAARALAALERVLPPEVRAQASAVADGVVSLDTGAVGLSPEWVAVIVGACRDHRRLRFEYRAVDREPTRRDVEPHRLVYSGRRWYLVARDVDRDAWRTFRTDRMADLTAGTLTFRPQEPPEDAATMVSRALSTGPYRWTARVRIFAPLQSVAPHVPASMAMVQAESATSSILTTGSDHLTDLAMHLGQITSPFEVLEPPELVDLLGVIGARMTAAAARSASGTPLEPSS